MTTTTAGLKLCKDLADAHGIDLDLVLQVAEVTDCDESAMLARLRPATAAASSTPEADRSPKGAGGRAVEPSAKLKACPDLRKGASRSDQLAWITRAGAFGRHPVVDVVRTGPAASSWVRFRRDGAPDVVLLFASLMAPRLLVPALSCFRAPDDDRLPAKRITISRCHQLVFAVNQLCPLHVETAVEQAAAIFGEFLSGASVAGDDFDCDGDTVARFELATALSPALGLPRYALNRGRPVVAVSGLLAAGRRLGYKEDEVEGIFEAAGWERIPVDGRACRGKDRKGVPHATVITFRAPDAGWGDQGDQGMTKGVTKPPSAASPCKPGGDQADQATLARARAREDDPLSSASLDDLRARCPDGVGARVDGQRFRWGWMVRNLLIKRDGVCCASCRRDFARERLEVEVDHVIPLALSGPHAMDNLQLLCADCHAAKTAEDRAEIREARDG